MIYEREAQVHVESVMDWYQSGCGMDNVPFSFINSMFSWTLIERQNNLFASYQTIRAPDSNKYFFFAFTPLIILTLDCGSSFPF